MTESSYQPLDRRPIQSRNTRWAERITNALVRQNISPNAISILGMIAAITAGVFFFSTSMTGGTVQRLLWFCGGLLCQVRLLCNLFDGMVAVAQNKASPTGELYNEVPDRVSDTAIFVGLGYAAGGDVALGFTAALLAVFVAYVRAMAKSIGAPNDFCGPMAKPQRMALVTILAIYSAFAPATWQRQTSALKWVMLAVIVGCVVTALRRLQRAAKYLEGAGN